MLSPGLLGHPFINRKRQLNCLLRAASLNYMRGCRMPEARSIRVTSDRRLSLDADLMAQLVVMLGRLLATEENAPRAAETGEAASVERQENSTNSAHGRSSCGGKLSDEHKR